MVIAANREFAEGSARAQDGRFRRRYHPTAAKVLRLCKRMEQVGSLYIAAPLVGVPRKTIETWMKEDPRIDLAVRRAQARCLAKHARRLSQETDAVLAQSARFALARLCPDYRTEKVEAADIIAALGRTVEFARRTAPKPEASTARAN